MHTSGKHMSIKPCEQFTYFTTSDLTRDVNVNSAVITLSSRGMPSSQKRDQSLKRVFRVNMSAQYWYLKYTSTSLEVPALSNACMHLHHMRRWLIMRTRAGKTSVLMVMLSSHHVMITDTRMWDSCSSLACGATKLHTLPTATP